ncbi:uncharacterized protein BO97DRAFT_459365 [Aspergillus homomorphus CBS 101889]|uniref:Uncharacterized protein n=1 Tax=Aspergillus homomorphus (strain CBS 101889) TaxID=1450537 RepID=A0A395HQQ6_ASPHC|nr:hypothetical protein BO97DRAFT_459365 [Aspergillus homomorphus CBS 101889]RAL09188.1 hypothetical protein BO97DRAFT_459365 [Aspergillus homomorphus CBS 101889]
MVRMYTHAELEAAEGLLLLWASGTHTITSRDGQGATNVNHRLETLDDIEHEDHDLPMKTCHDDEDELLPDAPDQSLPHPQSCAASQHEPSITPSNQALDIPRSLVPIHQSLQSLRSVAYGSSEGSVHGFHPGVPPSHDEDAQQYAQSDEQRHLARMMILHHVKSRSPGDAEAARHVSRLRVLRYASRLSREQEVERAERERAKSLSASPFGVHRAGGLRNTSFGYQSPANHMPPPRNTQNGRNGTTGHQPSNQPPNSTGNASDLTAAVKLEETIPRVVPAQSLQKYLIRQQIIAGVQAEQITPIRPQSIVNPPSAPVVLQIKNDNVTVPDIPPAQFSGLVKPLVIMPRPAPALTDGPVTAETALHSHPVKMDIEADDKSATPAANKDDKKLSTPQRPANSRYLTRSVARRTRDQNGQTSANGAPIKNDATADAAEPAAVKHEPKTSPAVARPPRLQPDISASENNTTFLRAVPKEEHTKATPNEQRQQQQQQQQHDLTHPHKNFDLLHALSTQPYLTVMICDHLLPSDIITLMAISQPMHQTIQTNLTMITTHQVDNINTTTQHHNREPPISDSFPLLCYPRHYYTHPAQTNHITPKLTYAQMLLTRSTTITTITSTLLHARIFLPQQTDRILHKLWFLMDIPDNHRREWTVRNRNLWSDLDLFLGIFFVVQLDAYLEKVRGFKNRWGLVRRVCFAQRSLVVLADLLVGRGVGSGDEGGMGLRMGQGGVNGDGMLPEEEDVGPLGFEYYGRKVTGSGHMVKLLRPDERIMREALGRGLDLQGMYKGVFGKGKSEVFETAEVRGQRITWDEQMRLATVRSRVDWLRVVRLDS